MKISPEDNYIYTYIRKRKNTKFLLLFKLISNIFYLHIYISVSLYANKLRYIVSHYIRSTHNERV